MLNNKENFDSKVAFIKSLPAILEANNSDYKIYYVTITFEFVKVDLSYIQYRRYFDSLFSRLKSASRSNSRDTMFIPRMIFLPEKSHLSPPRGMFTPTHYHGYFLIHKRRISRFENRYIERFYSEVDTRYLVVDVHRRFFNVKNSYLFMRTAKVTELRSLKEFYATGVYNGKEILMNNFTYDQILLNT